jgi:hypothetical protein
MAAVKAIGIYGKTRAVPDALAAQIQSMLQGMISEYMVEHTDRFIQMGGSGSFTDKNPSYIRYV